MLKQSRIACGVLKKDAKAQGACSAYITFPSKPSLTGWSVKF